MQQQRFLRPVVLVFINGAVMVIHTLGSDSISHSHFRISAAFPKISTVTVFQDLRIFLVTLAAPCTFVRRQYTSGGAELPVKDFKIKPLSDTSRLGVIKKC